jgi:hypothetical protein
MAVAACSLSSTLYATDAAVSGADGHETIACIMTEW